MPTPRWPLLIALPLAGCGDDRVCISQIFPAAEAELEALDFGAVPIDHTAVERWTLTNVGRAPLVIEALELSDSAFGAELVLQTNDPDLPELVLWLEGVGAPDQ